MPELMELSPGMSSVTQVLPDKVRNYLLKRFRRSGLDAEEWARRWRLAEDRLLEGAEDAFDVIVVLEQLGREAFEKRLAEEGLLTPDGAPALKGATASNYFMMPADKRQRAFDKLKRDLVLKADPALESALSLLVRQPFAKKLSKSQRVKMAMFLLELHESYLDYKDLGEVKASLTEMLEEEKDEFEEKMGFEMPDPDDIYAYLSTARWTFKKR